MGRKAIVVGAGMGGLAAAIDLARAGARSRVPGLYFAGGSVHPVPGVPMATLSGRRAAECVAQDLGF
jgi:1-hydroxycarotenoid 3,4-desaturase